MRLRPLLLSLCLAAVALIPAATAQDDVRLPHLGSNADQAFTQAEAEAYGASMLRQMRALGLVLDDPLATQYINALGYRLVSSSESPKTRLPFSSRART
ncbi:hypothetical protein B1B_16307 [mine drainage metagenome]|uniref:Uncharacterized protein n=1 Tax=mine drainage metagenome TaxID=410659 RepID=T0YVB3_9ZZZZ